MDSNILIWEKIKKAIDSCINHEQVNTCRTMLGYAVEKGFFKGEDMMEYHNDLSHRIRLKRMEIERMEDEKITVLPEMSL